MTIVKNFPQLVHGIWKTYIREEKKKELLKGVQKKRSLHKKNKTERNYWILMIYLSLLKEVE